MVRSVAQIVELTRTSRDQVKAWAWDFRDHLSPGANPGKGLERQFTDEDALKMLVIVYWWIRGADSEEICEFLERGDHWEDHFRKELFLHTPLFQDVPDDLDETWRHGCLYTPSFFTPLELARNYRRCANALLELALKGDETLDLRSPVFFIYRHSLELYLKILGRVEEQTHSLSKCLAAVESQLQHRIREPHRSWILELDSVDPGSTSFRYCLDDPGNGFGQETWIDYHHVRFAMSKLLSDLDRAILNDDRIWDRYPRV